MPPLFDVCAANAGVTALLGLDPVRLYPHGTAPEKVAKPYATFQVLNGLPENYIDEPPDVDDWTFQINIYADSVASVNEVRKALRRALEPHCYIERLGGTGTEPSTQLRTTSFDVSWIYTTQ
ncbi:gene transfer agent protein [Synechococcus phage Yong-L1-251]|nr:gene transfer agent protein [Synechococcus phage Yong-L1-251]